MYKFIKKWSRIFFLAGIVTAFRQDTTGNMISRMVRCVVCDLKLSGPITLELSICHLQYT